MNAPCYWGDSFQAIDFLAIFVSLKSVHVALCCSHCARSTTMATGMPTCHIARSAHGSTDGLKHMSLSRPIEINKASSRFSPSNSQSLITAKTLSPKRHFSRAFAATCSSQRIKPVFEAIKSLYAPFFSFAHYVRGSVEFDLFSVVDHNGQTSIHA